MSSRHHTSGSSYGSDPYGAGSGRRGGVSSGIGLPGGSASRDGAHSHRPNQYSSSSSGGGGSYGGSGSGLPSYSREHNTYSSTSSSAASQHRASNGSDSHKNIPTYSHSHRGGAIEHSGASSRRDSVGSGHIHRSMSPSTSSLLARSGGGPPNSSRQISQHSNSQYSTHGANRSGRQRVDEDDDNMEIDNDDDPPNSLPLPPPLSTHNAHSSGLSSTSTPAPPRGIPPPPSTSSPFASNSVLRKQQPVKLSLSASSMKFAPADAQWNSREREVDASSDVRRSYDEETKRRDRENEERSKMMMPGFGLRPAVYTSVDSIYEKNAMIGEGTYGKVYKATNRVSNTVVALKRVRIETEREGFPITGIRELKILTSLSHKNIVKLLETISEETKGQSFVHLVFEYMDHDLTGVFNNPALKWDQSHIKCLMSQLLDGLSYLHQKGIVHRDMKGSNLLLNKDGILKVADFGLARFLSTIPGVKDYTNRVITLWYRPPELLLGLTAYGPEIDMWSSGCIMAEMVLKKPIFPGNDEITQLDQIWKICGTPSEESWPGIEKLPWWGMMRPRETIGRKLRETMKRHVVGESLKLLDALLQLDPSRRPTAIEAKNHPYFKEIPFACEPSELPKVEGDWHEYESKQRKRGKQPGTELSDNAGNEANSQPFQHVNSGSAYSAGVTGGDPSPMSANPTQSQQPQPHSYDPFGYQSQQQQQYQHQQHHQHPLQYQQQQRLSQQDLNPLYPPSGNSIRSSRMPERSPEFQRQQQVPGPAPTSSGYRRDDPWKGSHGDSSSSGAGHQDRHEYRSDAVPRVSAGVNSITRHEVNSSKSTISRQSSAFDLLREVKISNPADVSKRVTQADPSYKKGDRDNRGRDRDRDRAFERDRDHGRDRDRERDRDHGERDRDRPSSAATATGRDKRRAKGGDSWAPDSRRNRSKSRSRSRSRSISSQSSARNRRRSGRSPTYRSRRRRSKSRSRSRSPRNRRASGKRSRYSSSSSSSSISRTQSRSRSRSRGGRYRSKSRSNSRKRNSRHTSGRSRDRARSQSPLKRDGNTRARSKTREGDIPRDRDRDRDEKVAKTDPKLSQPHSKAAVQNDRDDRRNTDGRRDRAKDDLPLAPVRTDRDADKDDRIRSEPSKPKQDTAGRDPRKEDIRDRPVIVSYSRAGNREQDRLNEAVTKAEPGTALSGNSRQSDNSIDRERNAPTELNRDHSARSAESREMQDECNSNSISISGTKTEADRDSRFASASARTPRKVSEAERDIRKRKQTAQPSDAEEPRKRLSYAKSSNAKSISLSAENGVSDILEVHAPGLPAEVMDVDSPAGGTDELDIEEEVESGDAPPIASVLPLADAVVVRLDIPVPSAELKVADISTMGDPKIAAAVFSAPAEDEGIPVAPLKETAAPGTVAKKRGRQKKQPTDVPPQLVTIDTFAATIEPDQSSQLASSGKKRGKKDGKVMESQGTGRRRGSIPSAVLEGVLTPDDIEIFSSFTADGRPKRNRKLDDSTLKVPEDSPTIGSKAFQDMLPKRTIRKKTSHDPQQSLANAQNTADCSNQAREFNGAITDTDGIVESVTEETTGSTNQENLGLLLFDHGLYFINV